MPSLEISPSRPQPTWYHKRTRSYHEATVLPEGSQDKENNAHSNETSEDQATTTPTRPKKRQSSAVGVSIDISF